MSSKPFLKVLILGDASVGKTSLMCRYVQGKFREVYKATIGADFLTKEVLLDSTLAYLQVWDTAGQDRFETLGRAFYRGTDVCILVYDITSPKSFERVAQWKQLYEESQPNQECIDHTVFAVFANKSDLHERRLVAKERAVRWCTEHGNLPHFEVSAKNGENVEQAMTTLAKQAKRNYDAWKLTEPIDDRIDLHPTHPTPQGCYDTSVYCSI